MAIAVEDAESYTEGVRRGGTLVVVRTDDANVELLVEILDQEGGVDVDEPMEIWRSEGWK